MKIKHALIVAVLSLNGAGDRSLPRSCGPTRRLTIVGPDGPTHSPADHTLRHAGKLRPTCGYLGQPHGPACQLLRFGHSAFTHLSPPRHRKREYNLIIFVACTEITSTGSARLRAAPRFADPTRRRVIWWRRRHAQRRRAPSPRSRGGLRLAPSASPLRDPGARFSRRVLARYSSPLLYSG
jgi:hypothetical protein